MTNLSHSLLKRSHKVEMPGFTKRTRGFVNILILMLVLAASWATAQVGSGASGQVLITQPINEGRLVRLKNNTRPEATAANDRGAVADQLPIGHMFLHLRRSPASERALQKFIAGLQNPSSPNFHQWITAQEFGDRFGLAKADLATVTNWLQSHGFKINVVYPNGLMIDFSGTAGQVREAFRTEIHRLEVNGRSHIANMSDPQIPAALAPAVAGIVSLHDFMPRTMHHMRSDYTFTTSNVTYQAVVPADLATIYNLNSLFGNAISGQGQTIVVIEDTDVNGTSNSSPDWTTFRSTFGLSNYAGHFMQAHPQPSSGGTNCSDPGVNGNDIEASLDAEWASAAAPSATIELASCSDSGVTFGGLIALQNLINQSGTPPAIVSISYGECESINGAAANQAYSSTYAQAVTEGVSVFVSSGDEGAASCDARASVAVHGIGVSGFASTPYNVAVGGTDFGDTYAGTTSTYWSSTNTATFGSAQTYVPEIPWNDSCASVLLANFESFPTTYGASGFCNSSAGVPFLTTAAGSGGPSGCATGAANNPGLTDGTCAGWPKPAWQAVVGNPADGVRDIPDVSLFAANGVWGHYYVFCDSDTNNGGTPCTGAPSNWSGAGGTSFSAPIMAGIQALVNQNTGSSQGNPNPIYYSLAAAEYGSGGTASCNSTKGNATANTCIFYDVTQGDIDLACYTGSTNCYQPSPGANYGVLSTSSSSYSPAYGTTTGWDFATGLGTVNAANLVGNWPTGTTPNFSLSSSPNNLTIAQTASGTSTITITPTNGFAGAVNLWVSGLPNGVTASFAQNPATTTARLTLTVSGAAPVGTVTLTIFGSSGNLSHTATISLNVVAAFSLSASPSSLSITQGASGGSSTITITAGTGFSGPVTFSATGLPSGVTASFNPNSSSTASTLMLTATYGATLGTSTVTIAGTSGGATETTTLSLTVVASPPPNFSVSTSTNSVTIAQGLSGPVGITVTSNFDFNGSVTLSATGLPNRVTASFNPNTTTVTNTTSGGSTLTLTASGLATVGTVTVTITGTSGGLTSSATITLTVSASTPAFLPAFAAAANSQVGTNPTAVAVGNFNGDLYPDLVVANSGGNTVSVLMNNGDGTFPAASSSVIPVGTNPTAVAVGDFNGDSDLDFVVANGGDGTVSVLLGNGNGTFGTATSSPITVGKNPTAVAVGDFNGDGHLDFVVANGGDGTVSILLGNGDGTFTPAKNSPYTVGPNPTSVVVGDFNGDGNLDLVVANGGSNTVSVLLGHGDGTFMPAVAYTVGAGPTAVAVGDGDVDGIADIVVANGGSSTMSVLVGNGDGTFKTAVSYPVAANPTAIVVGDFNGDGKQDVAVASASTNMVSILLGNGDCSFQVATPPTFLVGTNPVSLAVGDFDQNVKPDLAVANEGGNSVSILLNQTGIQAPAITSMNSATFTVGAMGAFTVTAGGFPAMSETGGLPSGVLFNDNRNGTASIAGIPAAGTGGSYPITFTASGSGTSAVQNFTLQVNQAAAITSSSSATFTVGFSGSFTVTASGYPAPVVTEAGTLPSGVTFNSGTLSGTPAPGTGGTYSVSFTAHNGVGADGTQTFTLTVDEPPAFTSANAVTFVAGTGGTFTVTTYGFPPPVLTVTGLPSGATFTDNGNGTGALTVQASATAGTSTLTFNAAGLGGALAIQSFTLTIASSQTITFSTNAPTTAAYGSSFTVVATGGGSGNPVTFTSSGVCTNLSGTYTMISGTGTCSVIANQAGNSSYLAAPQVTVSVTATLAANPITFTMSAPAKAAYPTSFTVAATGNSSNPIIYESYGSCRNSGATYTMWEGIGTCTVTAFQFNDNNYTSGSASETTTATPEPQTITFTTNAPASAVYGSTFTVAATGGPSGYPVAFTSSGGCTNSGASYTITGIGSCSVIANQAGSTGPYYLYAAAPTVTETTTGTQATQTITFTTKAPASAVYGSSFTVAATASSGLAVTYTSGGSCSNSGATFTITSGSGTCSVTASQAGNSNYAAATSVTESTIATGLSQTITFTTNPPSSVVYGTSFVVAATASSGLTVAFTSSGSCSNSGATYTMTSGTGTCSVIANQAGNGNYSAAPRVTKSTTAQKATATVSITNIPANAVAGKSFSPTYSTNSNGSTSATSSTSTVCTVSGSTVSFKAAGTCTLVAHTASTSNFNAGTGASQSFTIIAITLTSISPTSGLRGTSFAVTLTGTNLSGATAVVVSGSGVTVSNVTATSSTSVTATFTVASNASVSSRTVSVTTPIGSSNTVSFAVTGPTLTSISPTSGAHGTTIAVTLTGTNLTGATSISVSGGGVQVTNLVVAGSTTITANFVISSGATLSSRNVTVSTPIGTTTGSVTFAVQ